MNRRSFLALAPGLLVPEPVRAYSFVGGWRAEPEVRWFAFPATPSGIWLPEAYNKMVDGLIVEPPPGVDPFANFAERYRREYEAAVARRIAG
jgi:hypothetical protein